MLNFVESFHAVRRLPSGTHRVLAAAGVNQLGAVIEGFLVVYLVHRGFSPGAAALCAGAFASGTLGGAPVGAWVTGQLGPRAAMAWALMLTASLVALTPWVSATHSTTAICLLGLFTGVTTQAFRPPSSEALSRFTHPDDTVLAFSAFRVAMNAGALLAPLLAAAAIAEGWWTALFIGDALTCVVAATLIWTAPSPRAVHPAGRDDDAAQYRTPLLWVRELFTGGRVLYLAAMLTSGIVYCQTYSVLPLQLAQAGQPTALYAAILSLGAVTLVVLELPVTTATKHWPVPTAVFVGTLIFGLSYGLYAAASVTGLVIAGAVCAVAGTTISAPRLWSYPAAAAPRLRPALFAASQAAFGAGMAIGPVIGTTAWQHVGRSWWVVVAAVGAVSAVAGGLGTRAQEDQG